MRMFYRSIALLSSLIVLSLSIFFFIEDRDQEGKIAVFFAIYIYFLILNIFKSLYYRRQSATFNELSFVVGLPLIPILLVIIGNILGVKDYFNVTLILSASINFGSPKLFQITFPSVLSIPFYLFSLFLLLRTFIRYKFIRYTAYSTNGIPATFAGIIFSILIGTIYIIIGYLYLDILLLIFGIFYTTIGVLAFFA